jgi:CrcB protein
MALALTTEQRQNGAHWAADNAYLNMKACKGRQKMKSLEFVMLAIGAIVGVLLRYTLVESPVLVGGLQVNVLIVNIIGSFLLGIFSVLAVAFNLDEKYTLLVAVGFWGSFTTMSSFALETSNLLDGNRFSLVAVNILANVGLSLGAVISGRVLGDLALEKILR